MSVLAALNHLDDATDGQLLGRFVRSRDADAFAALVRRLGPTVLAVCRRVCPDAHLAEDAFQAAFLVLARKADTVRPREQVAVWLHGVAYRTASKARAMLANHRRRETGPVDLPDPSANNPAVSDDDDLRRLDAAITALPDHLRAAVVLCELEGRSRREAAKQLGIAEGTLSSRLADARKRLGDRLRPTAVAMVAALVTRTAEAVLGGTTSEMVRSLARGVMSMMLFDKLKLPVLIAVLAVLALAGLGFTLLPRIPQAAADPMPKKKEGVGGIGVAKAGKLFLLTADGKETHQFDVKDAWKLNRHAACHIYPSPQGFPVAVIVRRLGQIDGWLHELRLIRSTDDLKGEVMKIQGELTGHLVWSRTGKRFYVSHRTDNDLDEKYLAIDTDTDKATSTAIPRQHRLVGESPDSTLVTDARMLQLNLQGERPLNRLSADGKKVTKLKSSPADLWDHDLALAPDGHTVLSRRYDEKAGSDVMFTFDTATGKTTTIIPKELNGVKVSISQPKWSPDGKRVGFIYERLGDGLGFDVDRILSVCDLDGTNGKDVFVWRAKGGETSDAGFEWN